MSAFKLINIRYCVFIVIFLFNCKGGNISNTLSEVFRKASPYENYQESLSRAGLETSALGRNWIKSGQKALQDSLWVKIPFRETLYFPSEKTRAVSYRFNAKKGEKLVITTKVISRLPAKVFLDVFGVDNPPRTVVLTDSTQIIEHNVTKNTTYLLRLQPELLITCQFHITIESKPSFVFPVQGKSGKDIISIFGDIRDRGTRKHEGIDIISRKGTSVVASQPGIISRVGTNPKGGKVVYLADMSGHTLYYAHLDTQMVYAGQMVNAGDVIGTVGNTGNASTTVPHLHFGIYDYSGAIDPYSFVFQSASSLPLEIKNPELINTIMRASAKGTALHFSQGLKSQKSILLNRNTFCTIIGGGDKWLHVELPNGKQGFVLSKSLTSLEHSLKNRRIIKSTALYDEAIDTLRLVAKDTLRSGIEVGVFATFNGFEYVQGNQKDGWIQVP